MHVIISVERVRHMPWNMQDYPASFKNFETLERKKMIDIANALLANGYDEDRAIPIAIAEGKKWFAKATDKELKELKAEANPSKRDKHDRDSTNPDLLDEDVEVYFEDDQWKVKTQKAKRASDSFASKAEAIKRAKEIAKNKESKVVPYTKEDKKQNEK